MLKPLVSPTEPALQSNSRPPHLTLPKELKR